MANDIITLLQGSVAAVHTGVDDDTRAVAGSSGNKRISLEGGVFRKYVNGKEVAKIPDRDMDVILVRMAHNPSRTFYTGAYKKGIKVSPVCWSQDAKTPDASVKTPQASSCDKCPHSIKGTGQGGIGTACRISWRTAVVLPNSPDGDVMQLVIPGASVWGPEQAGLWRFRPYVQMLAANNISAGRVITKMRFDTDSSSPRLWFSPVAPVDAADLDVLARQGRTEAAERAIKLTVFQSDSGAEEAPTEPTAYSVSSGEAEVEEPKLRESAKAASEPPTDAADVIRKWTKKK